MTENNNAIIAALLWDRPTLVRSLAPGAAAFVEALGPPPYHERTQGSEGPLATAATGIRLEQDGKTEEALAHYGRLAKEGGWSSVLGTFLLAWSAASLDVSWVETAIEATRALEIRDDALRARLLVKLATYALDKGRSDVFAALIDEAAEVAPRGLSLHRAIAIARFNLRDRIAAKNEDFSRPADIDPLVNYDWIDALNLDAAQREIQAFLKGRTTNPWTWIFHSGRTPLDLAIAAERQATWAGALWKRDSIRKQLAAQLLNNSSRDAYQTFYALTIWMLAGGGEIPNIIDFAEPTFVNDTADQLIGALEAQALIPRVGELALPQAALALSDLLSTETLDRLLRRLRPPAVRAAMDQDLRHFWGRTSVIVPELWDTHFVTLGLPQQTAILEMLPVETLSRLSPTLAEALATSVEQSGADVSVGGKTAALLLWHSLGREVSIQGLRGAPHIAAEIALRKPNVLQPEDYDAAEIALRQQIVEEANAALKGSRSFGGRPTTACLAIVVRAKGAINHETTEELISLVFDERLPADFRYDVLMALAGVADANVLPTAALDRVRTAPEHGASSLLQHVSADLLYAARLSVRAKQLASDEQIAVLTLSRHPDARVRQVVCGAAGRFLAVHTSPAIEAALLATLFDPEVNVLVSALSALGIAILTEISNDAVAQRLVRLYGTYGRGVRAATVRAAKARLSLKDDGRLRPILQSGSRDRSWFVRQAATGESVG